MLYDANTQNTPHTVKRKRWERIAPLPLCGCTSTSIAKEKMKNQRNERSFGVVKTKFPSNSRFLFFHKRRCFSSYVMFQFRFETLFGRDARHAAVWRQNRTRTEQSNGSRRRGRASTSTNVRRKLVHRVRSECAANKNRPATCAGEKTADFCDEV